MSTLLNVRNRSLAYLSQRTQVFIKLAIIAGLFIGVLAVSWIAHERYSVLNWILATTIGMWAAIILLRLSRFEYGIMAIMLSAVLVNFFTLPTGRESRVVISLLVSMILVGIWIVQLLVSKGQVRLRPSPINLPIIVFVIVNLVSYVWSTLLRDPLLLIWESFPFVQLAALAVNIILPLIGLMVSNKVRETRWLRYLAWLMIILGTFIIVALLLNLGLDRMFRNGMRGLFSTWVVAFALSMGLFNEKLSRSTRGFLLGLVLAWTVYAVVIQGQWLSGWLPFMVAGAVITYLRSRQLFLLGLVAIGIVAFIKFDTLYYRIYVANVEEGSAQRADVWLPAVELVTRHPLFGTGPAGYAVYYMTYHPHNARSSHNNYFDILAQTGFVGFGVFIWIFGTFIAMGSRLRKAVKGQRDFQEAYAHAALGGAAAAVVAMMLGDWVIPFAYNQTITGFDNAVFTWIFLGGMVSLYHIVGVRDKS
jgi:O-antigen ligase